MPWVCTCGYDLAGLPPGAVAKCPECGVVIAEIRPKVPWFRHRGWLVALGLSPAMMVASYFLVVAFWPSVLRGGAVTTLFLLLLCVSVFASVAAFWSIVARAFRPGTEMAQLFAVLVAMACSLVVNGTVAVVVLMAVATRLPD